MKAPVEYCKNKSLRATYIAFNLNISGINLQHFYISCKASLNKVIEALQEIGYRVNKEKKKAIIFNNVMKDQERQRGISYKRGSIKRDTLKSEMECKGGKGFIKPKK